MPTKCRTNQRIRKVQGDKFAGEWPAERSRTHGISYAPAEKPKSRIYSELRPLLNSHTVALLDDRRLVAQLLALERRTARGARDTVDHPPGDHDDVANAAAGALVAAAGARRSMHHPVDLGGSLIVSIDTPSAAPAPDTPRWSRFPPRLPLASEAHKQ